MTDLSDLIDRVELELNDTANAIWDTDRLAAHVRTALRRFSQIKPRCTWEQITTTDGQREYSLASIGEILEVLDVWYPYTADAPEYPPERTRWQTQETGTLLLLSESAPADNETIRVLVTKPHTIAALDGASATTLTAQEKQLIVLGAAAYALQSQATTTINTITASAWTQRQYADQAKALMDQFEALARELARKQDLIPDGRVQWPALDAADHAEESNT